jgi:pimeloyl-ACP methyl ester carboxylesterase
MMCAAPVPGIAGALAAMRDRLDSTLLLSALDGMPALVLVGEHDQITPVENARTMVEALPSAQLEIIPGAGHLPPLEAPALVNAALSAFLTRLKQGRAGASD